MSTLGAIVGAVCAGAGILLMFVNGVVMLISPRTFFSLPTWLRAQGTLTEERYSSGPGAIQLRILGAVLTGGISWLVYEIATRRIGI
jgi:hypothetical protein